MPHASAPSIYISFNHLSSWPLSTQSGYSSRLAFLQLILLLSTLPSPTHMLQAPSLTLWHGFHIASCQSLPPFFTSPNPDHLVIAGSCPLSSIKSHSTIRTFIHSFKSSNNQLINIYCVRSTAVSTGIERTKQTRLMSQKDKQVKNAKIICQ